MATTDSALHEAEAAEPRLVPHLFSVEEVIALNYFIHVRTRPGESAWAEKEIAFRLSLHGCTVAEFDDVASTQWRANWRLPIEECHRFEPAAAAAVTRCLGCARGADQAAPHALQPLPIGELTEDAKLYLARVLGSSTVAGEGAAGEMLEDMSGSAEPVAPEAKQ